MSESTEPTGIERAEFQNADSTFTAFGACWVLATFFHIGSYGWWDEALLLIFAGFWVLSNPASPRRFLVFVTVQLFDVWLHLPSVPNHWLVAATVDLLVLLSYVRLAFERRSFRIRGGDLLRTFAPPVRIVVIIVYAFTLVHKLNWDFLHPDASCGVLFHRAYVRAYPFIPDGPLFRLVSIYSTLVMEAAIPLLLFFRRTRGWGVLLGLLFHGILSFNPISGFYNFSAMMVAVFLLFTREDFVERLKNVLWNSRLRAWLHALKEQEFSIWRLAAYALALAGGLLVMSYLFSEFPSRRVFFWLWIPYGAATILAFTALGGPRMHGERGIFRVEYGFLLLLPALVLVNGFSPYLGLKTETSFAMFSNLRTEGGETNHLLIPSSIHVFDYQRDLVEILSSTDPVMRRKAATGRLMTFFEFQDYLSRHPDAGITYVRRYTASSGETSTWEKTIERVGDDPEFATPNPEWKRKLLFFRDVSKGERQACMH